MSRLILCPYCNTLNVKPYAARIREGFPHYMRTVCLDCGLVFANPQASTEEIEAFYRNYYDKGNFRGWKDKVTQWKSEYDGGKAIRVHQEVNRVSARIFESASRYIPGRQRWLEVGAGLGELSYLAKQNSFDVTVTDLDRDAIHFMETVMGIEHTYWGDVTCLVSRSERYDIIVIHHVLEHVTDLFGTLAAIHELLSPGGMFFVGVPNMDSWGYMVHRGLTFLAFRIPDIVEGLEHTFAFTPKTLSQCLRKAGFEIKSIRTFGLGATSRQIVSTARDKGSRKALVALAENIFHTKMECVAVKAGTCCENMTAMQRT